VLAPILISPFTSPQIPSSDSVEIKQELFVYEAGPSKSRTSESDDDSKDLSIDNDHSQKINKRGRPRKTIAEYDKEIEEADAAGDVHRVKVLKNNKTSQQTRERQKERAFQKQNLLDELKRMNKKLCKQFTANEERIHKLSGCWVSM
jgi:hypothetical protein